MTCSIMSGRISVSRSMPSLCWVEMSTVFSATGRPSSYSKVTWVLPSGRRYGNRPGLADLGEALGHAVGQVDRQRHEHVGLVAGVAEHHPLVAGALLVELVVLAGTAGAHLLGVVDALGDVGRLLVDRDHDAARVPVVAEALAVVADVADGAAHRRGDVHVGVGGDLSCDDRQPGGDHRLAGDPGLGVLRRGSRRGWSPRSGRPSCRDDPRSPIPR